MFEVHQQECQVVEHIDADQTVIELDPVERHRAAKNYYRLLLLRWLLKQVSALVGLVVSLVVLRGVSVGGTEAVRMWLYAAEWLGLVGFVAQVPFTFLMLRLDYEMRWYVVTDRSLRIRSGLLQVREMTLTFANIQHLAVHQGPLQRMLGIYDLEVRTAGGGGATGEESLADARSAVTHIGYFHGVENAPAIRDLIVDWMRRARGAGLGDGDDRTVSPQQPPETAIGDGGIFQAALAEVRAETAGLRRVLSTLEFTSEGPRPG